MPAEAFFGWHKSLQINIAKHLMGVHVNCCKHFANLYAVSISFYVIKVEGRNFGPEKITFGNSSCSAGDRADWGRNIGRENVLSAVSKAEFSYM